MRFSSGVAGAYVFRPALPGRAFFVRRCRKDRFSRETVFKTVNAIASVIAREDLFSEYGNLNHPADINETDEEWLYAKDMFSDLLHEIGTCDFCIHDINNKLTFTREEWYIWLLLMINACNKTLPYTNP